MASFNVPAPVGTHDIGAGYRQGAQNFGMGIAQGFQQRSANQAFEQERRRKELELQQNLARIAAFQQQQQQAQQTQLPQGYQGPQVQQPNLVQAGLTGQYGNIAAQMALQGMAPQQLKTTQASNVIRDPNNPGRAINVRNTFDQQGNLINQQIVGEATLAQAIGGVAAEGLQGGTKTKIETDIIGLQETLTELEAIREQFDPDFFTFRGKGKAFFTDLARQAEIPVGQAQKDFLTRKTKFTADSERVFLKFRKFITGVAGGIQEFNEISKATINPEKGSDIQFQAKFSSMKDNAIRTQNVLLAMKNSGLDIRNPAQRQRVFSGRSLESVPLLVPNNVTLETLNSPAQKTRDQRIAELEAKARQ